MEYNGIVRGTLLARDNRFIARVALPGGVEAVHVRNTGRLGEILIPGAEVLLAPGAAPGRKTRYTLVAAYRGDRLVNIDSLAPNRLVYEAVAAGALPEIGGVDTLRGEVGFRGSRFDLYFEAGNRRGFIEIKGVTLESGGVAMFPDAPTARGTRHLHELAAAVSAGYEGYAVFVIQMAGVGAFRPNTVTDPAFGEALRAAALAGVRVAAYDCKVAPGRVFLGRPVRVVL